MLTGITRLTGEIELDVAGQSDGLTIHNGRREPPAAGGIFGALSQRDWPIGAENACDSSTLIDCHMDPDNALYARGFCLRRIGGKNPLCCSLIEQTRGRRFNLIVTFGI